ncbi:MAG: hypothetical protein HKL86_03595 [Acidimicrobiaceae bacterium]|nr:hypothetical protein [Acidimicrobiaceae bacterium]
MGLIERIAAYSASTDHFLGAIVAVTAENLDRHLPGEWSARQVIHHVADSETQSYVRLRRLLAEPVGSVIQGYDEAAWAQCASLGYRDLPVEHSTGVFRAVREASLDVLGRINAEDLTRYAVHSESGRYTLDQWLEIYTRHPLDHAAQLVQAISAP